MYFFTEESYKGYDLRADQRKLITALLIPVVCQDTEEGDITSQCSAEQTGQDSHSETNSS